MLRQRVIQLAGTRVLQRLVPTVTSLVPHCRLESSNSSSGGGGAKIKPDLPDLTTNVNIHEHRLKRPDGPPRKPKKLTRWKELETLEEDTKGSLIPETLKQMEEDEDFKITAKNLKEMGQAKLTREERKKRQRALDNLGIPNFLRLWKQEQKKFGVEDVEKQLLRGWIHTMQLNIGIYCNQACSHCHVESSPRRKEMMDRETAERCMTILGNSPGLKVVDITGGAPELCSQFRYLVEESTRQGKEVIDRCNLTSLLEPGQEDTAQFMADRGVHVVASMPCYSAKNVNTQRGSGVFGKSIQALINLNALGYGQPGSGLLLDLVYNPQGGYLPPPQAELEVKYKEELEENFGITFNNLYAFTNFPIKRFADFLLRRNELDSYMELLVRNFNLNTVDKLMCRNMLSVDYRGRLYDCDLNQQLDMPLIPKSINEPPKDRKYLTVFDLENTAELEKTAIYTDNHCFGCTAGMGSS